MRKYNRVMAGRGGEYLPECIAGGFIGVNFGIPIDLSNYLYDDWRAFNKELIPVYLEQHPGKARVAAGLSCGFTWTIIRGLSEGDVIISPDGKGRYHVGEIAGGYLFVQGTNLPHRRPVTWYPNTFDRSDMSEALRRSTGSIGTCCDVTTHAIELQTLIGGQRPAELVSTNPDVEDASAFALEKHLEDFLVANWSSTALGRTHDIFTIDGESVGQQFSTDTGLIDVLAVSKDGRELLVVELKKGRASDQVVGQVQRYMGYVLDELAEEHQRVRGVIIALEDDLRIRRALRVAPDIRFMRYKITFNLYE